MQAPCGTHVPRASQRDARTPEDVEQQRQRCECTLSKGVDRRCPAVTRSVQLCAALCTARHRHRRPCTDAGAIVSSRDGHAAAQDARAAARLA